jgi:hypothetical protein
MKTTREEIAKACYKVECEMSDIEPKIFDDLPFHLKLKYRAKADNWIKVYKILISLLANSV